MGINTGTLNAHEIISGSFSMRSKVSLVLSSVVFCREGELIQAIEHTKKYTIFERSEEQRDSKGNKIVVGRKFKVSNDLVGLYFK